MEFGQYPGGIDEMLRENNEASTSENERNQRISHNQYVTTRRSTSNIRN